MLHRERKDFQLGIKVGNIAVLADGGIWVEAVPATTKKVGSSLPSFSVVDPV